MLLSVSTLRLGSVRLGVMMVIMLGMVAQSQTDKNSRKHRENVCLQERHQEFKQVDEHRE